MPLNDFGCQCQECKGQVLNFWRESSNDPPPICPICGGPMETRFDLGEINIQLGGLPTPRFHS